MTAVSALVSADVSASKRGKKRGIYQGANATPALTMMTRSRSRVPSTAATKSLTSPGEASFW